MDRYKLSEEYTVACFGTLTASDFKGAKVVKLDENGKVELIPVDSFAEAFQHFDGRTIGIAIKNASIKKDCY